MRPRSCASSTSRCSKAELLESALGSYSNTVRDNPTSRRARRAEIVVAFSIIVTASRFAVGSVLSP
jgi:hypothetical protein